MEWKNDLDEFSIEETEINIKNKVIGNIISSKMNSLFHHNAFSVTKKVNAFSTLSKPFS